jgi:thioesterase domain-containing protein/acyl carrier protein
VLVAYVVAAGILPTVAELRRHLLAHLPDYMVPGVFVPLPALPLTPHGKVDRQALPAPDQHRLATGTAFTAPRTPAETKLASLWRELLNLPQVGIHDNFFALGGHSLLAVRMVNEIKHRMAFELPIRLVFQHPTIQELAKILPAQKNTERKPELLQLQPGTSGPELFFLIDEGSLGLLKLAHFLDKDLRLFASIVPIPETTLRAATRKDFAALPLMEEWAAKHVALIRSRPTNGPVRLAGHCFGGMLAFEVARQLQTAGVPVEAVLLLDTWMTMPTFWGEKKAWLQEHVGKLVKQGPQYLWRKSRRRIDLEKKELASRIDLAVHDDFDLQIPWIIIARIYRHAMDHYQPKPLASRGILFISQDDWMSNAFRPKDNTLGASRVFTGGVEVVDVPGNHVTVLNETHLPKLAEHYNRHLKTI